MTASELSHKFRRSVSHLEYSMEFGRCFSLFRRPLRMIMGYLGLPLKYPFLCETATGTQVCIANRMDLVTIWIIFLRREYAVHPDDEVIVDCGANIGVFSLYAASIASHSRLFAIEPFPDTFQRLRENIKRNRLDERVTCLPLALTARDGAVNMYAAPEVPSQSRQVIQLSGADTVSVPGVSFSSLLERLGVGNIDLLKMDIEGSEHAAFLNTAPRALACIKRIAVEYHQTAPKQTLFEYIIGCGFRLQHDRVLGADYGVAQFER